MKDTEGSGCTDKSRRELIKKLGGLAIYVPPTLVALSIVPQVALGSVGDIEPPPPPIFPPPPGG